MRVKPALLGLSFVYFYSIAASQEVENLNVESDRILHHDLKVFLDPKSRQISVEDVITLPDNLAKNTVASYENDLSEFAKFIGNNDFLDLNVSEFKKYVSYLSKNFSSSSHRKHDFSQEYHQHGELFAPKSST